VEDVVDAQITCQSNIRGDLHLDYFSRDNERKIQIEYDDKTIEGDLIKNSIKIEEKTITYKCNINETYEKQIKYFFSNYKEKNYNLMNNFSEASKTFKKIINFKEEKCLI
jgi:hypothetical protein